MKDRKQITSNGKAVFYASIFNDLREVALDNGWALGLHGSLNSDMDIMAMKWTSDACTEHELIKDIVLRCFTESRLSLNITSLDRPHNRKTYSIPIWADFYLDINIVSY